ncbi:hypothetical protein [Pantoea sp. 18069]|uniref:hypothetical protein n=1 Tax=Pantoea sp. 18069 TaxID=2681415 RepID=UPI0013596A28|nr:hypothetical protein [Pantoea sp. 18069]
MKRRYKYLVVAMIFLLSLVFFGVEWRGGGSQEKVAPSINFGEYSALSSVGLADKANDPALLSLTKAADASMAEEMMRESRDYRVVYEALVRSGSPKNVFKVF